MHLHVCIIGRIEDQGSDEQEVEMNVTVQRLSTFLFHKLFEISLIHNAEFIMLNDFARPKESFKSSEYFIS